MKRVIHLTIETSDDDVHCGDQCYRRGYDEDNDEHRCDAFGRSPMGPNGVQMRHPMCIAAERKAQP